MLAPTFSNEKFQFSKYVSTKTAGWFIAAPAVSFRQSPVLCKLRQVMAGKYGSPNGFYMRLRNVGFWVVLGDFL